MGWLPLRSPSLRIHNRKRSRYIVIRLIHPRNLDDFEAQQSSQIWLEAKSSHKISASVPLVLQTGIYFIATITENLWYEYTHLTSE